MKWASTERLNTADNTDQLNYWTCRHSSRPLSAVEVNNASLREIWCLTGHALGWIKDGMKSGGE